MQDWITDDPMHFDEKRHAVARGRIYDLHDL
jgi:hypothetical protein